MTTLYKTIEIVHINDLDFYKNPDKINDAVETNSLNEVKTEIVTGVMDKQKYVFMMYRQARINYLEENKKEAKYKEIIKRACDNDSKLLDEYFDFKLTDNPFDEIKNKFEEKILYLKREEESFIKVICLLEKILKSDNQKQLIANLISSEMNLCQARLAFDAKAIAKDFTKSKSNFIDMINYKNRFYGFEKILPCNKLCDSNQVFDKDICDCNNCSFYGLLSLFKAFNQDEFDEIVDKFLSDDYVLVKILTKTFNDDKVMW